MTTPRTAEHFKGMSYPTMKYFIKLWWHCLLKFHRSYEIYGNGINSDPQRITWAGCWNCNLEEKHGGVK